LYYAWQFKSSDNSLDFLFVEYNVADFLGVEYNVAVPVKKDAANRQENLQDVVREIQT
jgi:hypothetical protein